MTNKYTWIIESLDCIPSIDGQSNVVSCVHWRVNGTDGINNASVYGIQNLIYTSNNPFINYSNLTESVVIEWIQNSMGSEQVLAIQNNLDTQISLLMNPPVISPSLPWATT